MGSMNCLNSRREIYTKNASKAKPLTYMMTIVLFFFIDQFTVLQLNNFKAF